MPKYTCPICIKGGFDNLYDLQTHALDKHNVRVNPIEGEKTSCEKQKRDSVTRRFIPKPILQETVDGLTLVALLELEGSSNRWWTLVQMLKKSMLNRVLDTNKCPTCNKLSGSISEASRWLGISRNTLYKMMEEVNEKRA